MNGRIPLDHTSPLEARVASHLPMIVGVMFAAAATVTSAAETLRLMTDGANFQEAFFTVSGIGPALFAVPALVSAFVPRTRLLQVFTLLAASIFSILRAEIITLQPLVWFICSALLGWQYGFFTPERRTRTTIVMSGYFLVWTGKIIFTAFRQTWSAAPLMVGGLFALFVVWAVLVLQTRFARERADELDAAVRERTMELAQALEVKGQLLRELHHNSKSSLQMISSMLQFEQDALNAAETAQAIEQTQRRVYAAARLYDRLISSPQPGAVDLSSFLMGFFDELGMASTRVQVRCEIDLGAESVTTDFGLKLGMAISEIAYGLIEWAEGCPDESDRAVVSSAVGEQDGHLTVRITLYGAGLESAGDAHETERMQTGNDIAHGLIRSLGGVSHGPGPERNGNPGWAFSVPIGQSREQVALLSVDPPAPN